MKIIKQVRGRYCIENNSPADVIKNHGGETRGGGRWQGADQNGVRSGVQMRL